jgi:hypothetical protein
MKVLGIMVLAVLLVATSAAQWSETPGPVGGTVTALALNASNSDVYAQSANSIHRSTDGGATWSWVTGSLAGDVGVSALYASGTDVYFHDGIGRIYHSSNNGGAWTSATPSGFPALPSVTAMTSSGSTLLCGVNGNGFGGNGVYASTDNGATWTLSSTGMPTAFFPASFIKIGANLFAGAGLGSTSKGVYLSTNNGASWTVKDSTLTVMALTSVGTTLYVSTLTQGVWMTANTGGTWTKISTNASLTVLGAPSITATATNVYLGIAGVPGIYKVNTAGTTWDSVATGLPPRNAGTSIAAMTVSGSSLLAAFAGLGIYRSTNAGASWSASNTGLRIGKIGGVYSNGTALYASGITTGYFRSADHGGSWTAINNGLDLRNTGYFNFFDNGGVILAGGGLPGVVRSSDGGDSWSAPVNIAGPAYSFISDGSAIYAGTLANVVRTTDNGASWTTLTTGLPSYIAITAVWKDGGSLMAAASAGFKRSTDDGASWTAPVAGLPTFGSFHAFAQVDTTVFVAHDQGVYRSTNHGANWTATQAFPLGTAPIALHVHGGDFYSGTSKGVYRTTDLGAAWTAINEGLPAPVYVSSLGSDGQYLYAGMNSHSVWRRPLAEITDVRALPGEIPARFALAQNYPNPFNPSTAIRYEVSSPARVAVAVFDVLGREVARLVDRDQQPGAYEIRWEAGSRPSGVYFCRIQAGGFSAIRKMLLAK